jgi:hypothetical protein
VFSYLESHGTKSTCYYLNWDSASKWCNVLEGRISNLEENTPISWISGMLQPDQDQRWTAQALVDRIQKANENPDLRYAYSGICCINGDDFSDSDRSSKRSSMLVEETGTSFVGVYDPRSSSSGRENEDVLTENPSLSLTVPPSKQVDNGTQASKSVPSLNDAIGAYDATKSTRSLADIASDAIVLGQQLSPQPNLTLKDQTQISMRRKPVLGDTRAEAAEDVTVTAPQRTDVEDVSADSTSVEAIRPRKSSFSYPQLRGSPPPESRPESMNSSTPLALTVGTAGVVVLHTGILHLRGGGAEIDSGGTSIYVYPASVKSSSSFPRP